MWKLLSEVYVFQKGGLRDGKIKEGQEDNWGKADKKRGRRKKNRDRREKGEENLIKIRQGRRNRYECRIKSAEYLIGWEKTFGMLIS